MSSTQVPLETCWGAVSGVTVNDAAIQRRCFSEHQGSVTKVVAHELVPNGATHAIQRRDEMAKMNNTEPDENFEVRQHYAYHEPGEDGYTRPTFSTTYNSHMEPEKARRMLNITGGVDNIKDSTYGQGVNVATLTMSPDAICETSAYDALTCMGTTTLYSKMPKVMQGHPGESDHHHLSVRWYYDEDHNEIKWIHPNGQDDATEIEVATFNRYQMHSAHRQVKKSSGAFDGASTIQRIELLLERIVSAAKNNSTKSIVKMWFTGDSWATDSPFCNCASGTNEAGSEMRDILCRVPTGREEVAYEMQKLSAVLLAEWPDLNISTVKLPNGNTVCYRRGIQINGEDIEQFGGRDPYTLFVTQTIEAGARRDPNDDASTVTYDLDNFGLMDGDTDPESIRPCARVRICNHPDVEGRDLSTSFVKSAYEARQAVTNDEYGCAIASGGIVSFLGRVQGTLKQLFAGELTQQEGNSKILGTKAVGDLTVLGNNLVQHARNKCVDLLTYTGFNPDTNGNLPEAELADIDYMMGGREGAGIHILWSLTQPKTPATPGGLKPDKITDLFAKLHGYDVVCTVEHDLIMQPNKTKIASPDDGARLITQVRRFTVMHVLMKDPRFKEIMDTVHSEDWEPELYNNNMTSTGRTGPSTVLPKIGKPLTAQQRAEHSQRIRRPAYVRAQHQKANAEWMEGSARNAPANIYNYMLSYVLRITGAGSYQALDAMKLRNNSPAYRLRELVRYKNGVVGLPDTLPDNVLCLNIRHPQFAMMQIMDRLEPCFNRPFSLDGLPPAAQEYITMLENCYEIQHECVTAALVMSGKTDALRAVKKTIVKKKKPPKPSARPSARAGPSSSGAASSSGAVVDESEEDGEEDPNAEEFAEEMPQGLSGEAAELYEDLQECARHFKMAAPGTKRARLPAGSLSRHKLKKAIYKARAKEAEATSSSEEEEDDERRVRFRKEIRGRI